MAAQSLPKSPQNSEQSNAPFTRADRARHRYLQASGENGAGAQEHQAWRPVPPALDRARETHSASVLLSSLATLPTALLMGAALLSLELANAATSYFALTSLMGPAGIWRASFALLLTLGLAALDAGGLYRLFHPATAGSTNRSFGLWCVVGAWLICATTNAILTWWAVSVAMVGRGAGNAVLSETQLLNVAPVFLALALWLMRVLLVAGWAQGERG